MRKLYKGNPELYKTYYSKQSKGQYGGTLPAFHGIRIQRGYGIGSFLKGLFRSAVPLLKAGAKSIGKMALTTGMNVAKNYMDVRDLKSAAKSRALEAANTIRSQAVSRARSLVSQTGKGIKRRANSKTLSHSQAKKRKTSSRKERKPKQNKKKVTKTQKNSRKKKKRETSIRDIFGN